MSNKDYFARWLKLKAELEEVVRNDEVVQNLATKYIGVKPQATAVELIARLYCKYCDIFNQLCDSYDQMEQVQRREELKFIIDSLTCRIIELKRTLEHVECFEYTYTSNAVQQLIMIPEQVDIICPYFYPFEIRSQEMQYIIDEINAGNRLGDPKPTEEELQRREEARLEELRIEEEKKDAELKRKLAMGEEIENSDDVVVYTPAELEEMRLQQEYTKYINNIQRMVRSYMSHREKVKKSNKDNNLYLELAGLKKPLPSEDLCKRASMFIQKVYRKYMERKREKLTKTKLHLMIGMVQPSWIPPSAKVQLEKVKNARRAFRKQYYDKWVRETIKEDSHIMRLRKHDIMEDISTEVRAWFLEWYKMNWCFDEYPWPEEGGSILITRGETMLPEEYEEWKNAELKRLKAAAAAPKSKEQIKAEKKQAREEKKLLILAEKQREQARLTNYKKSRMNPKNDPGVLIDISKQLEKLLESWNSYEMEWKFIDTLDAGLDVIRGHIKELITENAYKDAKIKLRAAVDEMMRLELLLLKAALKRDRALQNIKEPPLIQKRKKPKKIKPPKPDKISPQFMYQVLSDRGLIKKYRKTSFDDFWCDRNYAAADCRAIPWVPKFPSPRLGDVKEQIRIRCLLTLGSSCSNAERAHLFIGPKGSGKRSMIKAIASETNSIIIDLSPMNVYNKFLGKEAKKMFTYVNKISRLLQPTIILVEDADKVFYKTVPKEEKVFNPIRFQKDLFKQIIKPIKKDDKILVLGTASQPWLSKTPAMLKAFSSTIMFPKSDYGSISYILSKVLMQYHGVDREFNVHSVAQTLVGYDINSIIKGVQDVMNAERITKLHYKPLKEIELVNCIIKREGLTYTDDFDYKMFSDWYLKSSPWGVVYAYYMEMLESQYALKLKEDKKKK